MIALTRAAQFAIGTYGATLGLDEAQQIAEKHAQIPLTHRVGTRATRFLTIDPRRVAGPIYAGLRATGRVRHLARFRS